MYRDASGRLKIKFPPRGWNPPSKRMFGQSGQTGNWTMVCNFLSSIKDVRIHICYGCGFAKLYDKNNVEYKARRMDKLSDVEALVEKIRKINNE